MRRLDLVLVLVIAACGGGRELHAPATARHVKPVPAQVAAVSARLPAEPGAMGPSLAAVDHHPHAGGDAGTDGQMLADVDTCATCHPDVAAQWASSAHAFASFGNPIFRQGAERVREELGVHATNHCAGCHDMPLFVDGLIARGVPPGDLRAHSGVTCRLCHGLERVTKDGNGSFVWSDAPIEAPNLSDPASIARHRAQVKVRLGTELCVGCHRAFIAPDIDGIAVHLGGVDEPGAWRSSAYAGNGLARIDDVPKKTCIDCHMARVPASKAEYGAKQGTIPSHRFLGAHTWMAAMRGDTEQLRLTQARLEGVASIDVAGALIDAGHGRTRWHLPADGAPVIPGTRLQLDVVVRNLLVGHRFPGGVTDAQDTWIEVEVADAHGRRLAESGLAHATDPKDTDAHVLRSYVVDASGHVLDEHELAHFRAAIATQTIAPRDAVVVRYAFDVPRGVAQPLTVTARLRHRSRTLAMHDDVCAASRTAESRAFAAGARATRGIELDPCVPEPITLIAQTSVQLGAGAAISTARPAWQREYEHGMALTETVSERLDEAKAVLDRALADAPAGRPRAMVLAQLAVVAAGQGRTDDVLALTAKARAIVAAPVLDAIAANALMNVWRWDDAIPLARHAAQMAPGNSGAWAALARCLGSAGDDAAALAAATTGLELAPRDPDLLRSQATALAALHRPEAERALAAYDRYRSPDDTTELRIACAARSARCAREREQGHTHLLHPVR